MSVEAMTWAFQQELPTSEKFVLVACANYADAEGYGFAGQKRLAKMCGCSDRTVRAALARLELAGYLKRGSRRRLDGSFTSDEYWIDLSRPAGLVPAGTSDQRQDLPADDPADGRSDQRQQTTQPAETDDTSSGEIFRTIEPSVLEPSEEPSEEPSDAYGASSSPPGSIDLAIYAVPTPTFDDFWTIWPRSESKKTAAAAWAKAIRRAPAAEILAAAEAYANSPWRPERQHVPYGATWLTQDRWNDPPPEPPERRRDKPDKDQLAYDVIQMGIDLSHERDQKAVGR